MSPTISIAMLRAVEGTRHLSHYMNARTRADRENSGWILNAVARENCRRAEREPVR